MKIGLLSIGETPRPDIMASFRRELPHVDIVEIGVLDGLTKAERELLAPAPDDFHLVSRLCDGSQCDLGKKQVTRLVNEGLRRFHAMDVRLVVLLCTCRFSLDIPAGMTVVEAGRVIDNAIDALVRPGSPFGILTPVASQAAALPAHYAHLPCPIKTAAASPYGEPATAEEAAKALKGSDFVVMHCMGYTKEFKKAVSRSAGCPVIQSNSIVARFAAELLASEE